MTAAIETMGLTKRYGRSRGIVDLDLVVETGQIFGFLGPNGPANRRPIRLLFDLIRPSSGHARVLGLDVHRDRLEIDRATSYVPGELSLYSELTGRQLLTYLGNLQRHVDAAYRDRLIERLELDPTKRIKSLSRGQQAEGRSRRRVHDPARAADPRRAHGRARSVHPAGIRAPSARRPATKAGPPSFHRISCPEGGAPVRSRRNHSRGPAAGRRDDRVPERAGSAPPRDRTLANRSGPTPSPACPG